MTLALARAPQSPQSPLGPRLRHFVFLNRSHLHTTFSFIKTALSEGRTGAGRAGVCGARVRARAGTPVSLGGPAARVSVCTRLWAGTRVPRGQGGSEACAAGACGAASWQGAVYVCVCVYMCMCARARGCACTRVPGPRARREQCSRRSAGGASGQPGAGPVPVFVPRPGCTPPSNLRVAGSRLGFFSPSPEAFPSRVRRGRGRWPGATGVRPGVQAVTAL